MSTKYQNVEERYFELQSWFDKYKKRSRMCFYGLQIIIISFSALTPVILLIEIDDGNNYRWLEGLMPALAAVAAGIQTLFKFGESWVSRTEASERLKSEYVYYKSRIGPNYSKELTEDEVVANFLKKIEKINMLERATWVSLQEKRQNEDNISIVTSKKTLEND